MRAMSPRERKAWLAGYEARTAEADKALTDAAIDRRNAAMAVRDSYSRATWEIRIDAATAKAREQLEANRRALHANQPIRQQVFDNMKFLEDAHVSH